MQRLKPTNKANKDTIKPKRKVSNTDNRVQIGNQTETIARNFTSLLSVKADSENPCNKTKRKWSIIRKRKKKKTQQAKCFSLALSVQKRSAFLSHIQKLILIFSSLESRIYSCSSHIFFSTKQVEIKHQNNQRIIAEQPKEPERGKHQRSAQLVREIDVNVDLGCDNVATKSQRNKKHNLYFPEKKENKTVLDDPGSISPEHFEPTWISSGGETQQKEKRRHKQGHGQERTFAGMDAFLSSHPDWVELQFAKAPSIAMERLYVRRPVSTLERERGEREEEEGEETCRSGQRSPWLRSLLSAFSFATSAAAREAGGTPFLFSRNSTQMVSKF